MDLKIKSIKVGPERTNCYVLSAPDGKTAVIDPGAESEKITPLIKGDLKYILLTHGHFDHVGAVDDLKKIYPDVPVYLGEDDFWLYRELPEQGIYVGRMLKSQKAELEAVSDGEFLPFSDYEIEVVSTPGHTAGGVCYKIGGNIFTGDTLFWHTIGRTDLPSSSDAKMKISLDKLTHLDKDMVVYPGHGKTSTLAEEVQNNPYLVK